MSAWSLACMASSSSKSEGALASFPGDYDFVVFKLTWPFSLIWMSDSSAFGLKILFSPNRSCSSRKSYARSLLRYCSLSSRISRLVGMSHLNFWEAKTLTIISLSSSITLLLSALGCKIEGIAYIIFIVEPASLIGDPPSWIRYAYRASAYYSVMIDYKLAWASEAKFCY